MPKEQSVGFRILALTAICGELPYDQLPRLPGGDSYKAKVIQSLKRQKLLRSFHRDGLWAYRLTQTAKTLLTEANPSRFAEDLSSAAATNHLKTEPEKRLRLHRITEATVTMENAGVRIYRDEKPRLFATDWEGHNFLSFPQPAFYNSREFKEMGAYFVKSHGARSVGVLISPRNIFAVYNLGNTLIQWAYKSEMRTKGVLQSVLCNDRLSHLYTRDSLHGLLLGNTMELAFDILSNAHQNQHFILGGNYAHFHFLTNDHRGERLLTLLCNRELCTRLEDILLDDLYEGDESSTLENDAFDEAGDPVLLGHTCDLPRIMRFNTALLRQGKSGTMICFDFQREVLARYCSSCVRFRTIDFQKWERRFFA